MPRKDANKRQSNHRPKLKAFVLEYKETLHCQDCGIPFKDQHWLCDFHHTNPAEKELPIANIIGQGMSLKRLEAELAKCIPLCANCHRTRHHNERQTNL